MPLFISRGQYDADDDLIGAADIQDLANRASYIVRIPTLHDVDPGGMTVSELNTAFGIQTGAIGAVADATDTDVSPFIYFNIDVFWYRLPINDDSDTTTTGRRINSSNDAEIQDEYVTPPRSLDFLRNDGTSYPADAWVRPAGVISVAADTSTGTSGLMFLLDENLNVHNDAAAKIGSGGGSIVQGEQLINLLPFLDVVPTVDELDQRGGVDDGCIMVARSLFFLKINGVWWTDDFD